VNITQSFKMAIKSITDNKARSILTMLGIIIGVAAVIIMVSVVQGANQWSKEYYEKQGTNKVTVNAYVYSGKDITEDLYNYCKGLNEYVAGVTPNGSVYQGIKYKTKNTDNMEYGGPSIYLGSDQYSLCNNFTLAKGRDISQLDIKKENQVIVLGARVAEYLFGVSEPVGQKVTVGGVTFTVVGVYEAKDPNSDWSMDNMAVIPYTCGHLLGQNTVSSNFTVKATGREEANKAVTMITGFLSGLIPTGTGDYYVQSQNQWQEMDEQYTQQMSMVVGGIAGISLLVGGIGIMNIMLVTVTERTREIGIRKAIGGSRRSIIMQFLIEAAVVCCCGGFIGVVIGYLGTVVAGKLTLDMLIFPSVGMTVGAVGFSVLLGIIFGMYPAIKASGLQPVEALRAD
jgi:putative ABC transport system permease protein